MGTTIVGQSSARIDGPLKVSGAAAYTSDRTPENWRTRCRSGARSRTGESLRSNLLQARQMPGVIEIYHRGNIGALYKPSPDAGAIDEARPPFADDVIRYYGQYVALAVAETFEQATAAAALVEIEYADVAAPNVELELVADDEPAEAKPARRSRGRVRRFARQNRPHVRDAGGNAQPHRAARDGRDVRRRSRSRSTKPRKRSSTIATSSARCSACRARTCGSSSKFLGSGFGGKLWPWTHGDPRGGGRAEPRAPRQAGSHATRDVSDGRSSPADAAARTDRARGATGS